MSFQTVEGRLGSGKTLFAVDKIVKYLNEGRRVACNFPLNTDLLQGKIKKDSDITLMPTFFENSDLTNLGYGGKSEHEAGLLVIDECMLLFNSRQWNDKGRSSVIEFFVNTRKLKWDVILIVQDARVLDKQIRESFVELRTICMRLDRVKLPIIPIRLPKLHLGITRYGTLPTAPVADRTFYMQSKFLISLYDSYTIFKRDLVDDTKSVTYNIKARASIFDKFNKLREKFNEDPFVYLCYPGALLISNLCNFIHRRFA
jgi:hypothetical protein